MHCGQSGVHVEILEKNLKRTCLQRMSSFVKLLWARGSTQLPDPSESLPLRLNAVKSRKRELKNGPPRRLTAPDVHFNPRLTPGLIAGIVRIFRQRD